MRLSLKQLKNLKVETLSGDVLGHVTDLILEVDGQMVAQYFVKPSRLSSKEYLIGRDAVLKIEVDKMTVEDSVLKVATKSEEMKKVGASPEAVAMRTTK